MEAPHIFDEIPEDKKKSVREHYKLMERLIEFQNKCTPRLLEFLFPKRGQHLFETFVIRSNRDILSFLSKCDIETQSIILTNIEMGFTYSNQGNELYIHS